MEHIGFPPVTVALFAAMIVGALYWDLRSHRDNPEISLKSAGLWSLGWIALAMVWAGYLWMFHGADMASLFITGYALEKALSVDNLFVFIPIFAWFGIPTNLRHRVLYWGVLGAIVFRGIFVVLGVSLLETLGPWADLLFAVGIAYTAVLLLRSDDDAPVDYENHKVCTLAKKFFPVWPTLYKDRFFVSRKEAEELSATRAIYQGVTKPVSPKLWMTPLFLCLIVIEVSDVIFALDSVPAVIAVSREPLIVYSAMMFAIMGLRSMYFVLEALKDRLVYLGDAIVWLLFFIATKLALGAISHFFNVDWTISPTTSLVVVFIMLSGGVLASFVFPQKEVTQ